MNSKNISELEIQLFALEQMNEFKGIEFYKRVLKRVYGKLNYETFQVENIFFDGGAGLKKYEFMYFQDALYNDMLYAIYASKIDYINILRGVNFDNIRPISIFTDFSDEEIDKKIAEINMIRVLSR